MTFEEWKDAYGLVHEPNYSAFTEADCLAAFNAGYTAFANELCEKCGQTRQHAGGGCIHCITEWCKDKVKEAQASAKPEIAIAEAYRCGEDSRNAEIAGLNKRLEQLGEYGLNSRAEIGKLQAEVDAEERRFNDLLDDFDRAVKERDDLVDALEDNWNCNPCETTRQQKAFDKAQSTLAKVRKTNEP